MQKLKKIKEIQVVSSNLAIIKESLFNLEISNQLLSASKIQDSLYKGIAFKSSDFLGCLFEHVIFENCLFEDCALQFTHFKNCLFINCDFQQCHWAGSSVRQSDFEDCSCDPWLSQLIEVNSSNAFALRFAESPSLVAA